MTRFVAIALLIVCSTAASSAQIVVGSEQAAPGWLTGRAPFAQIAPKLATDGRELMAAWVDFRSGEVRELYASRLIPSGEVLDPLGIRVAEWPADTFAFDIAFGRSTYLILDSLLTATEMDPAGEVVGRRATGLQGLAASVRLEWTGSEYLAVWGYGEMRFAFLEPSGVPVTDSLILSSQSFEVQAVQDIASNGQNSVVLFTRGARLNAAVVSRTGIVSVRTIEETNAIASPSGPPPRDTAAVATDGRNFLVIWRDFASNTIKNQLLGSAGEPLGDATTIAQGSSFPSAPVLPAATWNGQEFVVAYLIGGPEPGQVRLESVLVDAAGRRVSAPRVEAGLPEANVRSFALSAAMGKSLMVAEFGHPNIEAEQEVYISLLGGTGELRLVSQGHSANLRPSIATNGRTTLAAWEERRGSTVAQRDPVIVARRLSASGAPLGEPFDVSPGSDRQTSPMVAAGPAGFIVLWSESLEIRYRLLDEQGRPLTETARLPGGSGRVAVTWNGSAFAVARSALGAEIVTISQTGELLARSDSLPITTVTGFSPVAVACNASVCAAAWIHARPSSTCPRIGCTVFSFEIRTARFTREGTFVDTQAATVSTNVSDGSTVAMAAAGEHFILAWDSATGVRASRLTPEGVPVSEEEIIVETDAQVWSAASVTATSLGNAALVAWVRHCCEAGRISVTAVQRSPSGAGLAIKSRTVIADDPRPRHNPSLTTAGSFALLGYDRLSTVRGTGTVFVRTLSLIGRRRAALH